MKLRFRKPWARSGFGAAGRAVRTRAREQRLVPLMPLILRELQGVGLDGFSVLVAGASGDAGASLELFEAVLINGVEDAGGCHFGSMRIAVPSARRANATLGDLLMWHDREMLLPLLEDLRYLGEEQYMDWMRLLHYSTVGTVTVLAQPLMLLQEELKVGLP